MGAYWWLSICCLSLGYMSTNANKLGKLVNFRKIALLTFGCRFRRGARVGIPGGGGSWKQKNFFQFNIDILPWVLAVMEFDFDIAFQLPWKLRSKGGGEARSRKKRTARDGYRFSGFRGREIQYVPRKWRHIEEGLGIGKNVWVQDKYRFLSFWDRYEHCEQHLGLYI